MEVWKESERKRDRKREREEMRKNRTIIHRVNEYTSNIYYNDYKANYQ